MDAAQMPWSITALLSVAVRHAPVHGGVTVGARGSPHRVEVSVSDTGIGMSAAQQTNLFTQFSRTDTTRRQPSPGQGLGLSMVKLVVLAHEGQMSMRDTQGWGSTLTSRTPRHPRRSTSWARGEKTCRPPCTARGERQAPSAGTHLAMLGRQTVLIASDVEAVRELDEVVGGSRGEPRCSSRPGWIVFRAPVASCRERCVRRSARPGGPSSSHSPTSRDHLSQEGTS